MSVEPEQMTVLEGEEASFSCHANCNPPCDLVWRDSTGGEIKSGQDPLTLTITNTQASDHGTYTCQAENDHGKRTLQVQLVVNCEFY